MLGSLLASVLAPMLAASVPAASLRAAPLADEPLSEPAPPPPASDAPPAPERVYEGPTAIQPGEQGATPRTVPPPKPELIDAEPEPTPAATPTAAPSAGAGVSAMPAETWTPPPRREAPRALETIETFRADERAVHGKKVKFWPGIQVRNQVGYVSPFTLDRFGERYEEGAFSTGRIRWNPVLEIKKKLKFVGMLDLASGRWAPTGSSDPIVDAMIERHRAPGQTELKIVDPRELYLEWRSSIGVLRVGQQAFTWGQGILANNGNYVDRFGDMRFGDDSAGDIYERVLFGTKPFKYRAGPIKDLVIAVGADLVFRDERVDLVHGDLAGQALLVLRWQPEDTPYNWLGGYGVYRRQHNNDDGDVYPDDDDLEVGAFDFGGQGVKWLRDDFQLLGAFESAFIVGRTSAARDENGTHAIAQGGLAARGYLGDHERWLVGFDGGYASGDPDPSDRFINNFTFDAGHTVGLVLFQQVQGWRTSRTEILATDGELLGVPLNGTQFLPTRGGVSNAIYVHPKFRYALWEKLEFWGGPLVAAAPVPIVDPYTTRLAGGTATNSVGGDGGRRFYGTELDLGIRGRYDFKNLWLQAGLQGGILLPGAGIANANGANGNPVGAIWFRTEIRY